jgi:hypothetical protein
LSTGFFTRTYQLKVMRVLSSSVSFWLGVASTLLKQRQQQVGLNKPKKIRRNLPWLLPTATVPP